MNSGGEKKNQNQIFTKRSYCGRARNRRRYSLYDKIITLYTCAPARERKDKKKKTQYNFLYTRVNNNIVQRLSRRAGISEGILLLGGIYQ